jgi:hypothetical protein
VAGLEPALHGTERHHPSVTDPNRRQLAASDQLIGRRSADPEQLGGLGHAVGQPQRPPHQRHRRPVTASTEALATASDRDGRTDPAELVLTPRPPIGPGPTDPVRHRHINLWPEHGTIWDTEPEHHPAKPTRRSLEQQHR